MKGLPVLTVNVPLAAPAPTVTLEGTVATLLLLLERIALLLFRECGRTPVRPLPV